MFFYNSYVLFLNKRIILFLLFFIYLHIIWICKKLLTLCLFSFIYLFFSLFV